jgi:phytoene desaturase
MVIILINKEGFTMNKKVIVIGAGIGGLSCAVRLLSHGFDVKIYEKNSSIGGKVNRLIFDGFTFDLTASIMMLPDAYDEVFRWAGKNPQDYLDYVSLDPLYRVFFSDGTFYDFSSDMKKLTSTLDLISHKDSAGFLRLIGEGLRKYLLADKHFLSKSFNSPKDFYNPVTLCSAMKIHTLSDAYSFVSKYVKDEKLRQFLSFQAMYIGSSPYDAPNIYSLIPSTTFSYGLRYIKGGMYSYVLALEKLINQLGGCILKNSEIREVVIKDNTSIGVIDSTGFEPSDVIVCNADFPYAVTSIIPNNADLGKYTAEAVSKMEYSCSTFMLYLGINKKLPSLQVHNIFIGKDFRKNINAAFKGLLPQSPSLYKYCPSRVDNSMAPEGCECMNVMLRVPNLLSNKVDWSENTISQLEDVLLQTLSSIDGLSDIREHIIVKKHSTPELFMNDFNSYAGSAFGLSHNLLQTNYYRPQAKLPSIRNLYFTGASVHPGSGVSIVLTSSKLAARQILMDLEM